uniref:Retroviral polymerase SH3-like domain-containing protein n=1 Tax=Chenopodium quinoa TaxID=63459 RepID=A0A803MDF3_CHEQI
MKCVGLQYLEAIRKLKDSGFEPTRTIYLTFVPDEEIGGHDGMEKLAESDLFKKMNVAFVLDEGLASPGERMWTVIKATGAPEHGAKLYDNTAMENLLKSIEIIRRYRASQFDMVKAGLKAEGEVVSVNMAFLKAGTQTPTGFVMNLQPSEAEAGFDIRVPPTADQEALVRRIAEEWAPASHNMTFEFKQKQSVLDNFGNPAITASDNSNPWWVLLEEAIRSAGGELEKPEIFPASTDGRYFRRQGLPAIGFSPMANTPILPHDHNEFLNQAEYLKGVDIYVSIIKAYASYAEHAEAKGWRLFDLDKKKFFVSRDVKFFEDEFLIIDMKEVERVVGNNGGEEESVQASLEGDNAPHPTAGPAAGPIAQPRQPAQEQATHRQAGSSAGTPRQHSPDRRGATELAIEQR